MGVKGHVKPCEWAYSSLETLRLLERHAGRKINRSTLEEYVRSHALLPPKHMRKVAWRLMIKATPREVARFIQSRFGELKMSGARYEDLLGEADEHYPRYLSLLTREPHDDLR